MTDEKPFANVMVGHTRVYRHFKGGLYRLICRAQHTETNIWYAVYQGQDLMIHIRDLDDFNMHVDNPDGPGVVRRFTRVKNDG